jgi:hypothetical protein
LDKTYIVKDTTTHIEDISPELVAVTTVVDQAGEEISVQEGPGYPRARKLKEGAKGSCAVGEADVGGRATLASQIAWS